MTEPMFEVDRCDVIPARKLIKDDDPFQVQDQNDPEQLLGNLDVFKAGVDLLGRTGADEYFTRIEREQLPAAWILTARWGDHWESTAGNTAEQAMVRMLQETIDGGLCLHCRLPTGVARDFEDSLEGGHVCWYQFDPELKKFRRSCEGES